MKVLGCSLFLAGALSSVLQGAASAADASIQGEPTTEDSFHNFPTPEEARMLADGIYGQPDGTGGCDCSKSAILAIAEAEEEVLGKVPLSFLGLLAANSAEIWPYDWTPSDDFKEGLKVIKHLAWCATDALHYIDCGSCDIEYSWSPRESTEPGISHFECCCAVRYIKDLTIAQMHSVAEILNLNPGGSAFTRIAVESLKCVTKGSIMDLSKHYWGKTYTNKTLFLEDTGSCSLESFEGATVTNAQGTADLSLTDMTVSVSGGSFGVYNPSGDSRTDPTDGTKYLYLDDTASLKFDLSSPTNAFALHIIDWGTLSSGSLTFSNDVGESFVIEMNPPRGTIGNVLFFGVTNYDMNFNHVVLTSNTSGDVWGVDEIYYHCAGPCSFP